MCVCNGRESALASWRRRRRRSRSLTATSAPSVRDAVNVGSRQSRVTEEEEEEPSRLSSKLIHIIVVGRRKKTKLLLISFALFGRVQSGRRLLLGKKRDVNRVCIIGG